MSDATRYDVAGQVATITLAQPARRNALSARLLDALGDDLSRAIADEDVRIVVLTNDGPVFCAGADLAADPDQAPPRHGLVEILETILDAPKPIVGRIAGHCLGGGVGLAAACDLSIVADDARLGFTEVRLGVAPAIISVVCLPKMRRGDAAELFLSGEQITASRAVDVGLVNRAVPREALDGEVAATLARLLAGGPRALAASKDVLQKVPTLDRDEAFAWAGELSATLFRSEEAAAGQAAWREKVPAPWAPPSSD